jgi:hypothetical protein
LGFVTPAARRARLRPNLVVQGLGQPELSADELVHAVALSVASRFSLLLRNGDGITTTELRQQHKINLQGNYAPTKLAKTNTSK